MIAIDTTFGQHFDLAGHPLTAGSIYIGTANLNPITNPVLVYWDAAGTQIATQPIPTLNGYPVRAGTPALIYTNAVAYSMTVLDHAARQVFSLADSSGLPSSFPISLLNGVTGGATIVGYNWAGDGGPRLVSDKLDEVLSLGDCYLTGSYDDDDAMDTAIVFAKARKALSATSGCVIELTKKNGVNPRFNRGHVIDADYISIRSKSRSDVVIEVATDDIVFDFKMADGSTIYYGGVSHLGMRSVGTRSAGAYIRSYNGSGQRFDNLQLQDWYVGVEFIGATRCYITNSHISQIQRTTGQGLAAIYLHGDATAGRCSGNHLTDIEVYSGTGISAPFIHGLLVESSDGLYFENFHSTQGENNITFDPDGTAGNDALNSVKGTNVYLDACTNHGLWIKGETGADTYRDINFVNLQQRGADSTGVSIDCSSAAFPIRMLTFVAPTIRMAETVGVSIMTDNVRGVKFIDPVFDDGNRTDAAGGHDLVIRGDNVEVINPTFSGGSATQGDCIVIASSATKCKVLDPNFDRTTRSGKLTNNAPANSGYFVRMRETAASSSRLETTKKVDTSDATVTTAWTYDVAEGETISVEADVQGSLADGSKGTNVVMKAQFRRPTAGATAQVGATTVVHSVETDAGLNVAFDISTNTVRVRVTGLAATAIQWTTDIKAKIRG